VIALKIKINMIKELQKKYATKIIQDLVRKGRGVDCLFDYIFIPAIADLCKRKLEDDDFIKYNADIADVYETTILSYERCLESEEMEAVRKYILDHIDYYWD